ncbi:NHL repeat-containing thioredoxin family protein [Jatrophihabitans fulvus]
MDAVRTGPRVRAPHLVDGPWFNTDSPLTLAGLRGRFVLLDFWTFCCGNCLHVLDELRPLEHRLADVLTVIGVHSPKFPHEADPAALAAAVERYEVGHPVVNDPALSMWQQYAVRAWPTLVLVDPEGYVIAQAAGEGQVDALGALIDARLPDYDARGVLRRGDADFRPPAPAPGLLRFPADAVLLPAARTGRDRDTLLVADAGHHQIVELELDAETEVRRLGTGERGGPFAEPNGLALLPPDLAAEVGYDVLVADTANHVLRGIELAGGTVVVTLDLPALLADEVTIAGPVPLALSPWDVVWWPATGRAVVAAAGVHLLLSVDVVAGTAEVLAGTTVEGLKDGAALDTWLAQPSGLAVDGDTVWFVDAESSALRSIDRHGVVRTAVGEGLFDFGHADGPAGAALFQHPLGVTVLPDGGVAVLDTYNGAVRRYDPATDTVTTLARELAEPSAGLVVDGDLLVVESAAHRIVRPVPAAELVHGPPLRTERPPAVLKPGPLRLTVRFEPPPGRRLDDRYGPSTHLAVSASPEPLLAEGTGDGVELVRELVLVAGTGVLQVTAQAASCDDDPAVEHPVCRLARQDWGIPITVVDDDPDAADSFELTLLG